MGSAQLKLDVATDYPFEFAMVPLGKIAPHPVVQRAIRAPHVARIAANFDQNLLGVLSVTQKGRQYFAFDGQHRAAGMKAYLGDGWEIIPVPCHVYKNLDDRTCAKIANGLNTYKLWTPIDRFQSEVTAGEPIAVDITKMLDGYGIKVLRGAAKNVVRAVGVLRTVYEWKPDGKAVLSSAVGLLHEAWPEDEGALEGELIRGMALLFQKHGHALDRASLLHKLSARRSPDVILGQGRQYAKATGTSVALGVLGIIVRLYNTGRRTGKIEE